MRIVEIESCRFIIARLCHGTVGDVVAVKDLIGATITANDASSGTIRDDVEALLVDGLLRESIGSEA